MKNNENQKYIEELIAKARKAQEQIEDLTQEDVRKIARAVAYLAVTGQRSGRLHYLKKTEAAAAWKARSPVIQQDRSGWLHSWMMLRPSASLKRIPKGTW